ncbi:hypothetical protein CRG98_040864 [Punica granatum]|uniref:C2H2-type domain-containing protein n=1 Tax=Punica granatum TaxID=22663 RepID=A0A2I0I471_PUNGR|nr:hypothetical protein CRG98_040864 [Punica granatum]
MRGGGRVSTGAPLGDVSVRPGLGNEGKERGPFSCRECGQVFGSLKSLSNHRRVHVQPEKFNHGRSDLEETLANVAPICPIRRKRSRRVHQTAKDDAFGVKKVSDSNYKEVHSGEPNEEGKLVELKLQVDMVYLETECKNSEGLFAFGDGETVMRARAEAAKLGCESKELEECYGRSRKKPKLEPNWKESKNKIKIKKGSSDHRIPSPTGERQEKVLADLFPTKENKPETERESVDTDDKTYACPTCYKVFGSSQALGGHKRSQAKLSTVRPGLNLTQLASPETGAWLKPSEGDGGSYARHA